MSNPAYRTPPADPIALLRRWLAQAVELGVREPNATAFATTDTEGRPWTRTVNLDHVTGSGLVFATHHGSHKGRHLRANPWASALLYWRETRRQISVTGTVRWLTDTETEAMWAARPVSTHAMTVASRQSEPLRDVEELRARARRIALAGPQPRPMAYVGLELVPHHLEFWADGDDRLHERLRYDRDADGWRTTRLQP